MAYNLQQIFLAEIIGTCIITFFGNGAIANALLPNAKGHGIGFMGIAFGFGLGVFLAIQLLGAITGQFNPAVTIAVAVVGEISWKRMLVALCGQFIGGVLGGFFVWFTYFQHFQPLLAVLPDSKDVEINNEVLNGKQPTGFDEEVVVIKQETRPFARSYASTGNTQRRRLLLPSPSMGGPTLSFINKQLDRLRPPRENHETVEVSVHDHVHKHPTFRMRKSAPLPVDSTVNARIAEDQETKLVVFCTRPAVVEYYYIFCVWGEFFGTFILTYFALSIGAQEIFVGAEHKELYVRGLEPLLVGLLVFVLVLSIGGPTGPALNPARDLGPRIVHALAPIPGKGSSEWWYSWVPVLAPTAGAIVGAQLHLVMKRVLESGL